MSHLKAKKHQIRFLMSVRLSLRPFASQMEFDTLCSYDFHVLFVTMYLLLYA